MRIRNLFFQYDKWNDYGHRTQFIASLLINGLEFEAGYIKFLFEKDVYSYIKNPKNSFAHSYKFLPHLFQQSYTKIEDTYAYENKYISVPVGLDFYDNIYKAFKISGYPNCHLYTQYCIAFLHDSDYIEKCRPEYDILALTNSNIFSTSLLRDLPSRQAYEGVYSTFFLKQTAGRDSLHVDASCNEHQFSIDFNFQDNLFPSEINILIGSNGTGKTRTIHKIIESMLDTNHRFDKSLTIAQDHLYQNIILLSYSPFETYSAVMSPPDSGFHFFGFEDTDGSFSLNKPKRDSTRSLFQALVLDERKESFKEGTRRYDFYINALYDVAKVDFDDIYFPLSPTLSPKSYTLTFNNKKYTAATHIIAEGASNFRTLLREDDTFLIIKNGEQVYLSSGQTMFSYMCACIVGTIHNNSLIIMDEPECYLHPTLEITLIKILKNFLQEFKSHAIIATHSMIIAREIPASKTHILYRSEDGIEVRTPPMETFGSRLLTICSHVFDDYSDTKAFEDWAKEHLSKLSPSDLTKDRLAQLPPELMTYLAWED